MVVVALLRVSSSVAASVGVTVAILREVILQLLHVSTNAVANAGITRAGDALARSAVTRGPRGNVACGVRGLVERSPAFQYDRSASRPVGVCTAKKPATSACPDRTWRHDRVHDFVDAFAP